MQRRGRAGNRERGRTFAAMHRVEVEEEVFVRDGALVGRCVGHRRETRPRLGELHGVAEGHRGIHSPTFARLSRFRSVAGGACGQRASRGDPGVGPSDAASGRGPGCATSGQWHPLGVGEAAFAGEQGQVVEDPPTGDRRLHHLVGALVDCMGVLLDDLLDDLHSDRAACSRASFLVRRPLAAVRAPRRRTPRRTRRGHRATAPTARPIVHPGRLPLSYGRNPLRECSGCVALRFADQVRARVVPLAGRFALELGGRTEGADVGVVTNERLAAQRRKIGRHIERTVREAERRSPRRRGGGPGFARPHAQARPLCRPAQQRSRLVDALRRLLDEDLSVRAAAERVGVGYHQARQLIRAAEVGGQV